MIRQSGYEWILFTKKMSEKIIPYLLGSDHFNFLGHHFKANTQFDNDDLPLLVLVPGPCVHVPALEHVDQPVLGLVRALECPQSHVVPAQGSVTFSIKIEATFLPFRVCLIKGKGA